MPYVRLKHNERNGGISASLIGLCGDGGGGGGGRGWGSYPLEKSCSLRFISMTSMIQYELASLGSHVHHPHAEYTCFRIYVAQQSRDQKKLVQHLKTFGTQVRIDTKCQEAH